MGGRRKIFIDEASQKLKSVHGENIVIKEYTIWSRKAIFICNKCNHEWESYPGNTIGKASGCPKCAGFVKTQEEFIEEAKAAHGDKYDYSDTIFKGSKSNIEVFCKACNRTFVTLACNHVNSLKRGCKYCAGFSDDEGAAFIEKAIRRHGEKYNYSNVEYKNINTKVEIICKVHGSFMQRPADHLSNGGCRFCGSEASVNSKRLTKEDFIEKSVIVHGVGVYNYDAVEYVNNSNHVKIFCNTHKLFFMQRPQGHMAGRGCPYCAERGYKPSLHGILYVLQSGNITKIGITNRSVRERLGEINKSSGKDFRVIHQIKFSNGAIPQNIERNILSYLRLNYQPVDECYDGSTECFLDVNYDDLLLHVRHEHLKQLKEHYGT